MAKMQVTQHNITTTYYSIADIKSAIDGAFSYELANDPNNKDILRIRERISEHLGMPIELKSYHTKR
jgi:hypothetical protein